MYSKLDELARLNSMMDDIVADVNRCNEVLEAEYKQIESERLDEFMDSMHELAGYAKNLNNRRFHTDIVFIKQQYQYDDWDHVLIFEFEEDGDFNIDTNLYAHGKCLYSSKFVEFDRGNQCWGYCNLDTFEYGWNTSYKKASKKFIAAHANEILDTLRKMIEDRFEAEIKSKARAARKKQEQIVSDIESVK